MAGDQGDQLRIIILEDEPDVVEVFRRFIADSIPAGEVIVVDTPDEVLVAARQSHPNAVVLDHSIPGITTTEFVAALREACSDSVIVLFSGLDEETLRQRGRWLGITPFPKTAMKELVQFLARSCLREEPD